MERIMNEESNWDHVEEDAVEGAVVSVHGEEMQQVLHVMQTGIAPEPSDVSIGVDCCWQRE